MPPDPPRFWQPPLLQILDQPLRECVCSRFMAFIKKGKLPPFSSINNMKVDAVPPELTRLNTMEQRLIARVQAFMKLIVLPLGQRALAGQTINFPVNPLIPEKNGKNI